MASGLSYLFWISVWLSGDRGRNYDEGRERAEQAIADFVSVTSAPAKSSLFLLTGCKFMGTPFIYSPKSK